MFIAARLDVYCASLRQALIRPRDWSGQLQIVYLKGGGFDMMTDTGGSCVFSLKEEQTSALAAFIDMSHVSSL